MKDIRDEWQEQKIRNRYRAEVILAEVCSWCNGKRETLPLGMCNSHLHAAEAFQLIRAFSNESMHDKDILAWAKTLLAKVDVKSTPQEA